MGCALGCGAGNKYSRGKRIPSPTASQLERWEKDGPSDEEIRKNREHRLKSRQAFPTRETEATDLPKDPYINSMKKKKYPKEDREKMNSFKFTETDSPKFVDGYDSHKEAAEKLKAELEKKKAAKAEEEKNKPKVVEEEEETQPGWDDGDDDMADMQKKTQASPQKEEPKDLSNGKDGGGQDATLPGAAS